LWNLAYNSVTARPFDVLSALRGGMGVRLWKVTNNLLILKNALNRYGLKELSMVK
jgi:hypothetical protein